jgi:acid phosphatase (class A)
MKTNRTRFVVVAVFLAGIVLTIMVGCARLQGPAWPVAPIELRSGLVVGYLSPETLPHSLALLPHPPAAGSVAFALDEDASRAGRALQGTPRWTLAAQDADLSFPEAVGTFSCALDAPVTQADTPHLYRLMRKSLADVALSTIAAKDRYRRARPFLVNKAPICTPKEEARLTKSGSYPSGHTAVGWAWALIMGEIVPERIDAILARGRAFGQSRVVCNVHWQSDVLEGRFLGAGVVARLHADAAFRADLEAAKAEVAAVRARGLRPSRDCSAEAAAMALQPPPAP